MVTMRTIVVDASVDPVTLERGRFAISLSGAMSRLALWWRRRRTRAHLSELTEQQLRDVGLTPEMAEREIRKSRLLLVERGFQPPF